MKEHRTPPGETRPAGKPSRRNRFIPLAFFLAIGFVVLKSQFQPFSDWVDRSLHPDRWERAQACVETALAGSPRPDFSRLVKRGKVRDTQDGFLVEGVIVGQMGAEGQEEYVRVSCYLDPDGRIVDSGRKTIAYPLPVAHKPESEETKR